MNDNEEVDEYPIYQRTQDDGFLKWTLEPDEDVEYIKHYFRGEEFNDESGRWEKLQIKNKDIKPIVNNIGIHRLIAMLRSAISVNTKMTNLDEETVYNLSREFALVINNVLYMEGSRFNIRPSNYEEIIMLFDQAHFKALMRAWKGEERKTIHGVTQYIERKDSTPKEDRKKKFGIF